MPLVAAVAAAVRLLVDAPGDVATPVVVASDMVAGQYSHCVMGSAQGARRGARYGDGIGRPDER